MSSLLIGYRKPCRGVASQSAALRRGNALVQSFLAPSWWSLSCTYNQNLHPKAGRCQDQASSPGQEPRSSGRARAKSGAQSSAGSSSATWKNQQLFDFPKYCLKFMPFRSVGILRLPPGAGAGWHCWDGWTCLPCPAELCLLCSPRPLCRKAAAGLCWGWPGHGGPCWTEAPCSAGLALHMLGHSQGWLLLVASVWLPCDSSSLIASPLFLISRVQTGCWSPILECCLCFCAPWEADKRGTSPHGFPWSL